MGRDDDLALIDRLLADPATRQVTLTGPPGVGKTRLAVAAAAAPRFARGVAFVDLTEVRDPALVPAAVLAAVGAGGDGTEDPTVRLRRVLAGEDLLLVIDNCEHVLDVGPLMVAALAGCPGLRVLATSRERLHLRTESEVPVRPLRLPAEGDDLGRLAAAPAMEMLVQCVRRFDPAFDVTPANCAALVEICARLDGLPLALELAAARLKLFTPGELIFRLRHRVSILVGTVRDVPPRHRTLRAALAWSHDLLRPDERAAFRRLSVFAGGATLDAAGQVCALGDPIATITSLVDKSLVQRRIRPDGVTEFVMLESLREYAGVLLAEHGERDAVEARHARYFADFAVLVETAVAETGRAEWEQWAESVGAEQGNLRAALAHAMAVADAGLSLPLAATLGWYASMRARPGAGSRVPDRAPAEVRRHRAVGDSLGRALLVAAAPALGQGDLDDVEVLLTRVLAADDDRRCTAIATAVLGHVARARGHHERAAGHHARAADLFGALGDVPGLAWSRYDLALLARYRGDAVVAEGHLRESLTRFREVGDTRAVACASWALMGVEEVRRGSAGGAERLLVETHRCCGTARADRRPATCLAASPPLSCARREAGSSSGPGRAEPPRMLSAVPPVPEVGRDRRIDGTSVGALTVRERQVARLVADGSTNRQIGRALGIAEKTTEAHVHNIIRKLGAHNRAEVAARVSVDDETG